MTIYPNPTGGEFTIASLQDVPIESLQVFNLSGNLVKSREQISSARFKFESQLEQGTYLAIIRTRDGVIHRKKIVIL
ncbi:MAG: T9SS type A sorting domain-containing protein [Bacteroidota bacterium]